MAGEVSCGTSAVLVPDLVLIFSTPSYDEGFQVYGLGLSGDGFGSGMNMKRLFSIHLGSTFGTGFAVSGSNLFAVGSRWTKTPKECWIWDLTDWRNKDEFKCRKIQTLAEKPFPLVFEYSGRVFALAGLGHTGGNTPNPVFEVCDVSDGGGWRGLPDPPFVDEYCKEDPREMKSYAVIGKKLYLGLCYTPLPWLPLRQGNGSFDIGGGGAIPTPQKRWEYYTYDIEGGTWDKIIDIDSSMEYPVVKNFINHCWSEKIDHVDDDLMVFTSRNKEVFACDLNSDLPEPVLEEEVFACDLNSDLAEPVLEEEEEKADDDDDASSMPDETGSLDEIGSLDSADLEEYNEKPLSDDSGSDDSGSDGEPISDAFLPVQGLDIKKQTPKSFANSHMVAHLAGDIYCAVFCNLLYEEENKNGKECQKIHVTTFRAHKEERSIKATILDRKDFIADMVLNLEACLNIKVEDIGGGGAIPTPQKRWEYYTYDIEGGTWDKIIDIDSSMEYPVVKNFINHCWSEKIDHVDDDLMVFTSRNKEVFACDLNSDLPEPVLEEEVFACDLNSDLAEPVLEEEEEKADDDDDASSMPDETGSLDEIGSLDSADLEEYNEKPLSDDSGSDDSGSDGEPISDAFLPVQGLDIKKQTPKSFANSHMVAHLAGDIYCAVFCNLLYEEENKNGKECQKIHVTTFRAHKEERSIKATILDRKDFIADMVLNLEAWCKLRPVQQFTASHQMH